jgi:hypothetical protein
MARWEVRPTAFDRALANTIEQHAPARLERYSRTLTLPPDECLRLAATFFDAFEFTLSLGERDATVVCP